MIKKCIVKKPELPSYLAGKLTKPIWKNRFHCFSSIRKNQFSDPKKNEKSNSVLEVFRKIDFHCPEQVTNPNCLHILG